MNFILREWRIEDVDNVYKYANNVKIAANLRNAFPYPYAKADAECFIKSMIAADESRVFARAIEVGGEAIGSIGIFLESDVYEKCAELGYWLAEPFWGRGIMPRAILEMTEAAFILYDLERIEAEPFATNTGSLRALEKAGYTLEGILKHRVYKNGVVLDACMYARYRGAE